MGALTRRRVIDMLDTVAQAEGVLEENKVSGLKRALLEDCVFDALRFAIEDMKGIARLVRELQECREAIKNPLVLVGFNMAVALCNKHLSENKGGE